MSDTAVLLIRELIREDLQLAWSHIEDGNEDFALSYLGSAVRKVMEIKQVKGDGVTPLPGPQTQLLTINNDPTHEGN